MALEPLEDQGLDVAHRIREGFLADEEPEVDELEEGVRELAHLPRLQPHDDAVEACVFLEGVGVELCGEAQRDVQQALGVDLCEDGVLGRDQQPVDVDEGGDDHLERGLRVALEEGLQELDHLDLRVQVLALVKDYNKE